MPDSLRNQSIANNKHYVLAAATTTASNNDDSTSITIVLAICKRMKANVFISRCQEPKTMNMLWTMAVSGIKYRYIVQCK